MRFGRRYIRWNWGVWLAEAHEPFGPSTKDAQKYMACFETLAQLALAMAARERKPHRTLAYSLTTRPASLLVLQP